MRRHSQQAGRKVDTPSLSIITGAHRSGTTWLGKAIAASDTAVLHEPFNYDFGVYGVNQWYPEVPNPNGQADMQQLMDTILSGKAQYRTTRKGDSVPKAIARKLTGGPDNWAYHKLMKHRPEQLVLKDPFCTRLVGWLADAYHANSLVLVRHPAAWLNSLKRMSWSPPLDIFPHSAAQAAQSQSLAFQVGVFWKLLYRGVLEQKQTHSAHIMLMKHEDLCQDPISLGKTAFDHLGVLMTPASERFLTTSTSGDVINPEPNVLHSMERNAGAIVNAWMRALSQTEIDEVVSGAGDVFETLYLKKT